MYLSKFEGKYWTFTEPASNKLVLELNQYAKLICFQWQPGHLKIMCAECATPKPKYWNEWMIEKNILGFKLCTEATQFFSDALVLTAMVRGILTRSNFAIENIFLFLTYRNEADWCIYASVNHVIIGSDDGLSPVCHQVIIWTNEDVLQGWF